jgi:predicted metal-binding membrane protein
MEPLLYGELAPWYRLLDPPEDHRDEAAIYQQAIEAEQRRLTAMNRGVDCAGMPPANSRASDSAHDLTVVGDRATVAACAVLLALTTGAWVFLVSTMGTQDEPAMETMPWSFANGVLFVAGWAVMMVAMMLPSALPMIALYGATQRKATGSGGKGVPVAVFTFVYLGVWAAVGVPVHLASIVLGGVTPDVVGYGVATILFVAGAYQLSPLKQVCLRVCRSPLGFLLGHWRAGYRGSLALGWSHAMYCLGCCWALMLVLIAAGAMGLAWVLLIAAVVAAEKLLPRGEWIARGAGGALLLLGVAVAVRPELAAMLRAGHSM